ncbi:hypothetical protein XHC_1539 [Xanthomonas hortorum pv. carotae str. M081]|nr:hypothetical protein XHC_1539 [Xanthomonas hortorum pv. carotae str. M081]
MSGPRTLLLLPFASWARVRAQVAAAEAPCTRRRTAR